MIRIPFRITYLGPLAPALLAGCSLLDIPGSGPDETYRVDAEQARELQVPPDLGGVGQGEQYVLPGSSGAAVTQDTLLPVFKSVQFKRLGAESWISISAAPEDVWPRVLAFARREQLEIARTEPVNGVILTHWRVASADKPDQSLLRNLIPTPGDDTMRRVLFRLERDGASGTRLFVRTQVAEDSPADDPAALWAGSELDDSDNLVLQRLLVYLGLDEQRVKGLIDSADVRQILDPAVLVQTTGGTHLVVRQGLKATVASLRRALPGIDMKMLGFRQANNTVVVEDHRSQLASRPAQYLFKLTPVHISAVQLELLDAEGRVLSPGESGLKGRVEQTLEKLRRALVPEEVV